MEIISLLNNIWTHLSQKIKRKIIALIFLMVFASFAEMFNIMAIMPLLSLLSEPNTTSHSWIFDFIAKNMGYFFGQNPLNLFLIFFILSTCLVGVLRVSILWMNSMLAVYAGTEIGLKIYDTILNQNYEYHLNKNTSEVINAIVNKTNIIIGLIGGCLQLISSVFILISIVLTLFIINPMVALAIFFSLSLTYFFIVLLTKKRLLANGEIISAYSTEVIKLLQHGLGGIRDILLDGTQSFHSKLFNRVDISLRLAQGKNLFISACPRYLIELSGIIFLAFMAYYLSGEQGMVGGAVPILGAFALGAQRLLPVLQQIFSTWSGLRGGQPSLLSILEIINQSKGKLDPTRVSIKNIEFTKEISLEKISFRYFNSEEWVFKKLSLSIKKGDCVGISGKSGCGKSTFLDLILGLLSSESGSLLVDGVEINERNQCGWRALIAHVPQTIFLADVTVGENIAFGTDPEKIDYERVIWAAQKAHIHELISSWSDGYKTVIGERGARLSGGQRQRVGIARAFYKKAQVIILDEATSALDEKTEEDILGELVQSSLGFTILMVTHRPAVLKKCNSLLIFEGGEIKMMRRN